MLSDLPDGAPCFVDANIICYHIIQTPPLSDECARFIKRIERGAVRASTSAAVVAEAIHKVMLAELSSNISWIIGVLPTDCSVNEI
jgi:predicted nucleic acid-binding protein